MQPVWLTGVSARSLWAQSRTATSWRFAACTLYYRQRKQALGQGRKWLVVSLPRTRTEAPSFSIQVFHVLVMLFAFIDKQGNKNNKNSKQQLVVHGGI